MTLNLNPQDRRILEAIGQTELGREFLMLLDRMKAQASSITGIAAGADYGAEVEGRRIFASFMDELVDGIRPKVNRNRQPMSADDYD